jgi:single-strand DNA-binding protein
MARGLNKVQVIGNLGQDPDLKYLPSGVPVTTFSVAATRTWRTPEGDERDETEWFRCVAWRQLAETANAYLQKGRLVYVAGRLRTRRWQDEAGQDHSVTEVEVDELIMLDSRPDPSHPAPPPDGEAEDPPF